MKRFYKEAGTVATTDGWQIALDGRPVGTPDRALLIVHSAALAHAIADEWNAQPEEIDPRAMAMTGLANATIDRVLPDCDGFVARIAAYGESDLLCYRAETPDALVVRQAALWDPVVEWAAGRYGVRIAVTAGILPVTQDAATLARLSSAVALLDPWLLAPLSNIVGLSGSLIASLAALDGHIDPDGLWAIGSVDEDWQAEQWGADADASALAATRRAEFDASWRFIALVRGSSALRC